MMRAGRGKSDGFYIFLELDPPPYAYLFFDGRPLLFVRLDLLPKEVHGEAFLTRDTILFCEEMVRFCRAMLRMC